MVERAHLEALGEIREAAEPDVAWALTGSLSVALRGIHVEPDDVDVQTTEAGAYELERRLSGAVVDPVSFEVGERIRSHFGALEVAGVRVEVIGDVEKRVDGSWTSPIDVAKRSETVTVAVGEEVTDVPVLPLEYEARAYERLGRHERAALLRERADGPERANGSGP